MFFLTKRLIFMAKVTLKQVAQACNVSINTASLAMRNSTRLPQETRERIQQTAKAMNYTPNRIAQALIGGKTQTIGLLMYALSDSGHLLFFNAVEESVRNAGYILLVEIIKGNDCTSTLNQLHSSGIDGLIVNASAPSTIQKLKESGIKNICLAGKELVADVPYDQIYYSEYAGSVMLMEHLINSGHKRIGFITANPVESDPRLKAYRDTIRNAGIMTDSKLIAYIPYGEFSIDNIDAARGQLMGMKERPTAIFAYHDEVALKLMFSLKKAGFSVPDDVSVTGINNTWAGEFYSTPLTSVDLKLEKQGKLCAETVISRIADPDRGAQVINITPELFVRESTLKLNEV
jgi:DNA-binding LacI/PurR family transcriptional regulator